MSVLLHRWVPLLLEDGMNSCEGKGDGYGDGDASGYGGGRG